MNGCAIGQRVDRFVDTFTKEFSDEYRRRSDPNIPSNDKYESLRKFGELQLKVSRGLLTRDEARRQIEPEDYDRAFDAVTSIAKSAAQDAFHRSNPEIELAENLPTIGASAITGDDVSAILSPRLNVHTSLTGVIADLTKPGVNLSSSFSRGRLELEPTLRLGRTYSFSYSTKEDIFTHDLRYRYERFTFRGTVKHDQTHLVSIAGSVNYLVDNLSTLNFNYVYDRRTNDHAFVFGFVRTW